MTPEDREVYQFSAAHYPDLRKTWDASQAYYREQFRRAKQRREGQTEIDQQLTELHALAIALETAAQTIRRVCYRQAMRGTQKGCRPEEAERHSSEERDD